MHIQKHTLGECDSAVKIELTSYQIGKINYNDLKISLC